MPWDRGDQIALRYSVPSQNGPTGVYPVTVVRDDCECSALYLAAGTQIKHPVQLDGSDIPRDLPFEDRA